MAGRMRRALQRMTDQSVMSWWRPLGSDAMVTLPEPDRADESVARRRDGSSADLRERQRDLAFDMYAEALLRIAD